MTAEIIGTKTFNGRRMYLIRLVRYSTNYYPERERVFWAKGNELKYYGLDITKKKKKKRNTKLAKAF